MIKVGCSGCDAPLTEQESYVTYADAIADLVRHGYLVSGDVETARELRVYCARCAR